MSSALAVAVLAGCGGHKQTPAAMPHTNAPDQAVARAAVLRLADLPDAWTAEDDRSKPEAGCTTIDAVARAASGRASSSDFSQGSGGYISQVVLVFHDERRAGAAVASITGRGTRDCLASVFQRLTTDGATFSSPTTGVMQAPAVGDQAAGAVATVTASADGQSAPVNLEVIAVRVGRAVATLLTADVLGPVDHDLRDALLRLSARRLSTAQSIPRKERLP